MAPSSLMPGWYILVRNFTCNGHWLYQVPVRHKSPPHIRRLERELLIELQVENELSTFVRAISL